MVRSFLKASQALWPKDKISNVLSIHFIPWKWRKNERLRKLSFAKLSLGHAQYDSFLPFLSFGKIECACWKWLQSKLNLELGQRRQLTNNSIIQFKQSNSLHFYHNCFLMKVLLISNLFDMKTEEPFEIYINLKSLLGSIPWHKSPIVDQGLVAM